MPSAFPPIEPVKTRGAIAQAAGPVRQYDDQATDLIIDKTATFAAVIRGMAHARSGRYAADMVLDIALRMFRERTSSMLDDLAEVWWAKEHEGARVRPFSSLPIADRAELRARVKKLLVDRVPDALGDQAVLEAERRRLLDLPAIALRRANAELERRIERDRMQWLGAGAAAMCAIFAAGEASIAHLGDCRAMCLRAGRAEVLTREHTLPNDYADQGHEVPEHLPTAITRAVGLLGGGPQVVSAPAQRGDLYLLMTRGVHESYSLADLTTELQRHGVEAAPRLVQRAESEENVAAVAVEIL